MMTFSDFISAIGIITSIVFGFFISHWCSIKDSRTRLLKDYYIEQVKAIKGRTDKFFHQVAWGKSSANKIVRWYEHICLDIDAIDKGMRKVLDIHMMPFGDNLSKKYQEITFWEDFNDQYSNSHYHPTTEHTQRLLVMLSEIDDFLNVYIDHVNQSNNFSIWTVQWRKIQQNKNFYSERGASTPWLRAFGERIGKHFWELSFCTIVVCGCCYIFCHLKKEEKPEKIAPPLLEIASKQDLLYKAIFELKEKYSPVEVHTKSFNNSSFFSAEHVDSFEVKVYQGK